MKAAGEALALLDEPVEDRRSPGDDPTTLNRKRLGQWWASLEEILAWVPDLGIDVLPVVDSTDELLPPAGT